MQNEKFPRSFIFGTATAAAQIEGAPKTDGKGDTIWDTFCKQQGAILEGATCSVACDSYHNMARDIAALKYLGVSAYRFSISWARIFPKADGKVNQAGIDHYLKFINMLLAENIKPYVTLFHWDLPQYLEDNGGWLNRDTAYAFAKYAAVIGKAFHGKVKHYMTFNEIPTFAGKGYRDGVFAPGKKYDENKMKQLFHHILLAHGFGVQALRHADKKNKIGLAHDVHSRVPLVENTVNIAASKAAFDAINGRLLDAIFFGKYPENEKKIAVNLKDDLKIISEKLDFIGLNIYSGNYVSATPDGFNVLDCPPDYPTCAGTGMSWLAWVPTALYWSPRFIHEKYFKGPIFITENGYGSSSISRNEEQLINDSDRIAYLRQTIAQVLRAVKHDIPINGYFEWTLMDNFEWAVGYTQRFGLFYTDFNTKKLKPKHSADFYAALINKRKIV
jgi:beta-glucosidase